MAKANMSLTRNAMPVQDALVRAHNFDEVALGYTEEQAIDEANRCLNCKNMPCVTGCPVKIHIPEFISKIKEGDFAMREGQFSILYPEDAHAPMLGTGKIKKMIFKILK